MERWRGQSEITIVTPVKPEAMSALGELLGAMAREHGVHLVMGVIERDGGTLYCTVLFFDPEGARING